MEQQHRNNKQEQKHETEKIQNYLVTNMTKSIGIAGKQCFSQSVKAKQETKQKQDKNKINHTKNKTNIKTERQKHEI